MNKPRTSAQLLTLSLLSIGEISLAAPLWSDFSGAYVVGSGFTLDPNQQQTLSLEYASGYHWGDTYTYLDTTFFRRDQRDYSLFGETTVRWSVMDAEEDRSNHRVSDIFVSASLEFGSGTVETVTLGPSVDLKVVACPPTSGKPLVRWVQPGIEGHDLSSPLSVDSSPSKASSGGVLSGKHLLAGF